VAGSTRVKIRSMMWEQGRNRPSRLWIPVPCWAHSTLVLGAEGDCAPDTAVPCTTRHGCGRRGPLKRHWCYALSPEGWRTHGWLRGEPSHHELSAPERSIFCEALLLSSCKSTRVQVLWGSVLHAYYA